MADIASGGNSQLQLKGAAQLAKGLRQAGADLKDLRDINEQAAQIVAPAAKALAPQRSGRLAKSIRAGATQKAGVVRAGNNGKVKYAGVINYGWPKHNIKVPCSPTRRLRTPNHSGRNSTRTRCRKSSTESRQEINEMNNETKTPNTRITYLDGHADEVCVTMWQRCQAETHAKAKGWGSALDAVVKLNAYAAYVRCRQIGATSVPFEQWADTVVSVVDMNNDPTDTEEQAETMNGPVPVSSGDMADAPGFSTGATGGTAAASVN